MIAKKLPRFDFSWPLVISSLLLLTDYSKKTHKILWEDPHNAQGDREKIRFTGPPFIILGRKIYDCQHGKARDKRKTNPTGRKQLELWKGLGTTGSKTPTIQMPILL